MSPVELPDADPLLTIHQAAELCSLPYQTFLHRSRHDPDLQALAIEDDSKSHGSLPLRRYRRSDLIAWIPRASKRWNESGTTPQIPVLSDQGPLLTVWQAAELCGMTEDAFSQRTRNDSELRGLTIGEGKARRWREADLRSWAARKGGKRGEMGRRGAHAGSIGNAVALALSPHLAGRRSRPGPAARR